MNPFVLSTRALLDVATIGLHAASAHDLADSLNTLRTNIDEFRTGFVSGTLHGVTNITGIYEGLCNTVHALGEFAQSAIAFNAEQEALTFAIESERYDDARIILAERSARAQTTIAAALLVLHQADAHHATATACDADCHNGVYGLKAVFPLINIVRYILKNRAPCAYSAPLCSFRPIIIQNI